MSPKQTTHNQIITEISLIPEGKRQKLYDLIHQFRMGLELLENNINEIMNLLVVN